MDCTKADTLLSALLDGEVRPADRAALDEHLTICSTCVETLETLRLQDSELRAAFAPDRAAADALAAHIIARLPATRVNGRGRRMPLAAVFALAAGVLIALLFFRPWQQTQQPEELNLVILRLEPKAETPDLMAFAASSMRENGTTYVLEMSADVIALSVLGETFQHHGEKLVRLHLKRVLKGELPTDAPSITGQAPTFCCPSDESPQFTSLYQSGTQTLLYLSGSRNAGWRLLGLRPLDEKSGANELWRVERCLAVNNASQCADPQREYRRLFADEAGGLDSVAWIALTYQPDPQAAEVLLEHLEQARARIVDNAGREPQRSDVVAVDRLSQLLARVHEARAVRPLWACTQHFPPGQRKGGYASLPELCKSADEATLVFVRRGLIEEIKAPMHHADDHAEAVVALGKLADSDAVTVLLQEQAKRPFAGAHGQVLRALRAAAKALGGKNQERIREAWLSLLQTYHPPARPTDEERDFMRDLVQILKHEGLTGEQKKQLYDLRKKQESGWFRQELEPWAD